MDIMWFHSIFIKCFRLDLPWVFAAEKLFHLIWPKNMLNSHLSLSNFTCLPLWWLGRRCVFGGHQIPAAIWHRDQSKWSSGRFSDQDANPCCSSLVVRFGKNIYYLVKIYHFLIRKFFSTHWIYSNESVDVSKMFKIMLGMKKMN